MKSLRIHCLTLGFSSLLFAGSALAQQPSPTPKTNVTTLASDSPPSALRNIRFQFEGIPYADVIERFAQLSGKPVVGEINIPGTITFNDPSAYDYPTAFDTLNVILSMKGQMLVEEGAFLRVVTFS